MDSVCPTGGVDQSVAAEAADRLRRFRGELYGCLGRRADELFELTDAVLCAEGSVRSLVGLCLVPEHRRGHGALYDALNHGSVDADRLRRRLAELPVPRMFGGRIVLALDVSPWLRPDAPTCPDRLFCHVYGRGRARDADQRIPGWPYQLVAALESGPTSWTAILDAVRLGPADDATAVTAAQLRAVVHRLQAAGHWRVGDPAIMVMLDSGYDVTRLAFVLADLPVHLVGRIRADRVMLAPASPRRADPRGGRPRRHGEVMTLADPDSWPAPTTQSITETPRYGKAQAISFDRMHPRLTHRGSWADHAGRLPIVEGTVIRLQVEHLPGQREAKPVWLWSSTTGAQVEEVARCWQAYLRRFDLEHTFRLFKQTLGWTAPKIRSPAAADRWTWLIIAAHTQLRLARDLAVDLRRPWEKPLAPERLTPARVRRGFRHLRAKTGQPASAPKPSRPGPGRPPGAKNRQRAIRHDIGKTVTRATPRNCDEQVRG
jgi:DDE superfamily endonuclease